MRYQPQLWSSVAELSAVLGVKFFSEQSENHVEHRFQHLQFKIGQCIYRNGQDFESLYIVNSGFLKTVTLNDLNNDQVTSFPMRGDALGVDAIYNKKYTSDAIALTPCNIIVIPYAKLQFVLGKDADFDGLFITMMSRELALKQSHLCLLGSSGSEVRVAQFLIRLGNRYGDLGYSPRVFELRMTRHEIGSYLGLTLETVSRTFSKLQDYGWITVSHRQIAINAWHSLEMMRKPFLRAPKNRREQALRTTFSAEDKITLPEHLKECHFI